METEGLIGFFLNTVALRTDLSDNPSFTALLQQVKNTTLDAYEHQQVPFEKIVERLVKDRDMSRSSLFQTMFILQNTPPVPELLLGILVSAMGDQVLPLSVDHDSANALFLVLHKICKRPSLYCITEG